MGKVCIKHILILLWKIVKNAFFLDSKHVRMGAMLLEKCIFSVYWGKYHQFPLEGNLCI